MGMAALRKRPQEGLVYCIVLIGSNPPGVPSPGQSLSSIGRPYKFWRLQGLLGGGWCIKAGGLSNRFALLGKGLLVVRVFIEIVN